MSSSFPKSLVFLLLIDICGYVVEVLYAYWYPIREGLFVILIVL